MATGQTFFFAHGFSRITMDELAIELKMSKKTLYNHFPSKNSLVEAIIERFTQGIAAEIDRFMEDPALDFASRTMGLLDAIGHRLALIDRHFLEDLQRQAPHVWERIEDFRRQRIFIVFGRLFREGAAQGHFRKDLDPALILQIYFHSIQNILNPRALSTLQFSPSQVFESLQTVLLEGILTPKGRTSRMTGRRKER